MVVFLHTRPNMSPRMTNTLKAYLEARTGLQKEKATLESRLREINSVLGGAALPTAAPQGQAAEPAKRRKMSAAARARIAAAAKARWAKVKATTKGAAPAKPKRRTMSAAARAKMAAAARTRWAKAKAAGRKRL